MKINNLMAYFIVALLFGNCTVKEVIPAYLFINDFVLTTNEEQGSNSHQIKIAYVHVDDEYVGAFILPATIPVIKTGQQKISITPGIYENGISNTPIINRFYKKYETEINLSETKIDTITPQTSYVDNTIFEFVDNFEGSSILKKDLDYDLKTFFKFTKPGGFENFSGHATLEGIHDTIAMATYLSFSTVPDNKQDQYFVELNYKCNSVLRMGLQGVKSNGDSTIFFTNAMNPSESWKKIYLNITNPILESDLQSYHIFFESTTTNKSEIWLDNFKFLHF